MIVEDESLIAIDLKFMLEDNGYEVVAQANNGETAIELAFLHKPQLILMDIKMPKLDGLKERKNIKKKRKRGKHTGVCSPLCIRKAGSLSISGMKNPVRRPYPAQAVYRRIPECRRLHRL